MKVAELQINQRIYPKNPPQKLNRVPQQGREKGKELKPFAEVLKQTIQPQQQKVRFSAHALKRIEQRQLELAGPTLDRLNEGLNRLNAKGSKHSLILMDNTAFVVSVRNRTVVTAIDQANSKQNIFTNIDSVAIV